MHTEGHFCLVIVKPDITHNKSITLTPTKLGPNVVLEYNSNIYTQK